eukprot:1159739-Pelagomonas_calceolata.AAC.7
MSVLERRSIKLHQDQALLGASKCEGCRYKLNNDPHQEKEIPGVQEHGQQPSRPLLGYNGVRSFSGFLLG